MSKTRNEVVEPEESKALATQEAAQLPAELEAFTGLEGLDASSFVIPRFKIVQPTSKEGTPGMLRINLTGDEFSEMPIVVVKASQARIYWDPDPKNDKALCRSYDFFTPDASIEKPFSPVCAKRTQNLKRQEVIAPVCPCAKWNGQEKPECSETYNLLCLQAEDLLPFWITLSGVSLAPVRRYLSAIALRRSRLFQWETILYTVEHKEPQRHYLAAFSAPRPLVGPKADAVAQTIVDLGLATIDIRRTFEAEEAATEAGGSESPASGTEAPGWMG